MSMGEWGLLGGVGVSGVGEWGCGVGCESCGRLRVMSMHASLLVSPGEPLLVEVGGHVVDHVVAVADVDLRGQGSDGW